MNSNKIGGGNKPQPYIPAGNGDKSGEYTNKSSSNNIDKYNCNIKNEYGKHNFLNSKLVKTVTEHFTQQEHVAVPTKNKPNSVIKKVVTGYVVSERFFDSEGSVYLDIDYTCHGNPIRHPIVPHIHRWTKGKDGKIVRGEMEEFR